MNESRSDADGMERIHRVVAHDIPLQHYQKDGLQLAHGYPYINREEWMTERSGETELHRHLCRPYDHPIPFFFRGTYHQS